MKNRLRQPKSDIKAKWTKHQRNICPTWSGQLYAICYLTGIGLIRKHRRMTDGIVRLQTQTAHQIMRPLWKQGIKGFRNMAAGFKRMGHREKRKQRMVRYVMPILSAAGFILTIGIFKHNTLAIAVEYEGETIGYIENTGTYQQAQQMLGETTVNGVAQKLFETPPKYKLTYVEKNQLSDTQELSDRIVEASHEEIGKANGLYVDGNFVGAVQQPKELLKMLEEYLEEVKNPWDKEISFANQIELKQGVYPVSEIVDFTEPVPKEELTAEPDDQPQTASTQPLVENDSVESEMTRRMPSHEQSSSPQKQVFEKAQEMLGIKQKTVETYTQSVPYETDQVEDGGQLTGWSQKISDGREGQESVTAEVEYVDGEEVSRTILTREVTEQPVNQVMSVGSKRLNTLTETGQPSQVNFIQPVRQGWMSCDFFGYPNHNAVDLAAPRGTPIYAAAGGTVVESKYFGAYGNYVVIDHGQGIQTVYAHNSKNHVYAGQQVGQGQHIANMGSTGNSTGNHLHLELRINGVPVDPMKYLEK